MLAVCCFLGIALIKELGNGGVGLLLCGLAWVEVLDANGTSSLSDLEGGKVCPLGVLDQIFSITDFNYRHARTNANNIGLRLYRCQQVGQRLPYHSLPLVAEHPAFVALVVERLGLWPCRLNSLLQFGVVLVAFDDDALVCQRLDGDPLFASSRNSNPGVWGRCCVLFCMIDRFNRLVSLAN